MKGLLYAGMTWQGIVHWDDMRTVDYLLTRTEVDPQRIGCNGISLGRIPFTYLAGLDERIAAANVVGFMSTTRSMIHSHLDTHSWVHFPPTIHRYLDLPDIVSMMAPKPCGPTVYSRRSVPTLRHAGIRHQDRRDLR